MHRTVFALIGASLLSLPANAATIGDGVKADMPALMTLYRDLHANPELSMQEVRSPAKLAVELASSASPSPRRSARRGSSR